MDRIPTLGFKRLMALTMSALMFVSPLIVIALPYDRASFDIEVELLDPDDGRYHTYVNDSEWPMYLFGPGHSGLTSSPVPLDNGTIWHLDMSTTIRSSPVVVNNTLYLATTSGMVHAINASTGKELWTHGLGSTTYSSPAIYNNKFVIGTWGGNLMALNLSDGKVNWTTALGAPVNSTPIISDGVVYVGTDSSKVWAFDISNGTELWNQTTTGAVSTSPALSDGVLLVSSLADIQAFNSTNGTPLWSNSTAGATISGPLAIGYSSEPFGWLTYVSSDDDKVYAFNTSNGDLRWSSPKSAGSLHTPTEGPNILVSGKSEVMAFNYSNGNWMWNFTVSGNISTSAVTGDGDLLVGTDLGVEAADIKIGSASALWSYALPKTNDPALAYGRAFLTTMNGMVTAFGHKPISVIDSLTPDPVHQGDVLTLSGHGSSADAFMNYKWSSDIDGLISEGPVKGTTLVTDLSPGTHTISFMVQDDNWTWSEPVSDTVKIMVPSDWPMFRQNTHRTASSDSAIPIINGTKWVVDLTGATEHQDVQSSPIIIDDMAFIGTRDFFLHSLNLTTGKTNWAFKSGGSIDSTPAYSNGYMYVGSGDTRLYCLDANPYDDGIDEGILDFGASYDVIWSFDSNGPIWSSPVVVNDVAYFTTDPAVDPKNPNPGRLYAVSTVAGATTRELWHFTIPNNAPSFSSPVVYQDLVVFGANDNRIYAINRTTGQEEWNLTTGDSIRSSPTVANGLIFIGSNDDRLYAIYPLNGTVAWSSPTGDAVESSPAVAEGVVYVGSMDHTLYAFDASNGAQLWTYDTGDGILSSPAVASGNVIFSSFDGFLYVVNTTTHDLVWKRYVTPVAQSSPAVARDSILIGSSSGYIYAIGKAPDLSIDPSEVTFSLSTPQVGVQVKVTAIVRNTGTIKGNGTVGFFDGSERIGTSAFVSLAPADSIPIWVNWTPTSPGSHLLTINISGIKPHDSDASNNKIELSLSVRAQTEGWRMFHKDEGHSGMLDVPTPNNNDLLWRKDLGTSILSSPLVADSLVFVGGVDGTYSLFEDTGGSEEGTIFHSNTSMTDLEATPAVVNGVLYVPSMDGFLYAIDAWNWDTLWSVPIGPSVSAPIVVDKTVILGNEDGEVYAINAANGSIKWKKLMGGNIVASPAAFNDIVVIGNDFDGGSSVNAYNISTGDPIWSYPTGHPVRSSAVIDTDGSLYIADINGTVYKMEADPDIVDDGIPNNGEGYDLIWKFEAMQPIFSSAAISGNNIYLTVGNSSVLSINTNGGLNWWRKDYTKSDPVVISSSPAIAQNKLFVGGNGIYCLDTSTGSTIWNFDTATKVVSSPAISLGKVFFTTKGGEVLAFGNISLKPPKAVITSPLPDAEFRQNEEITFDASGSTDDGVILTYGWDFGDGNSDQSMIVTHHYDNIGNYSVTLTVGDNEIPPFYDNISIMVHIIENAAPILTNGTITPSTGNISTMFNFTVSYRDPDGDPPAQVKVTVSGVDHILKRLDGGDTDYTSNVVYYCSTRLPSGNHTYAFKAHDGVLPSNIITGDGLKVWQVATFVQEPITVTMEFLGQGQVNIIGKVSFPPDPPALLIKKDDFIIQVDDILEWRWMWLGINGTDRNLTKGVVPGSLGIYWYNGTWVEIPTNMDIATEQIWMNVTFEQTPTLGTFSLFGEPFAETSPPQITRVEVTPTRQPDVNQNLKFTVHTKYNGTKTLRYRFNWSDGSKDQLTQWGTSDSATHKFTKAQTFYVVVYITDDVNDADRTSQLPVQITVREEGSQDALIILAIIIFIVLAVAFAIPIKGSKEDEDAERRKSRALRKDEEIPKDEEGEGSEDSEE